MSLEHPSGSDPQGSPPDRTELFGAEGAADAVAGISHEITQLYLTAFGRGPLRARTYVQPEFCVCVLGEILTEEEHALVEDGRTTEVEAARGKVNEEIAGGLVEIVERQTGRPVLSHLSRLRIQVGMAVHFFLFDDGSVPDRGPQTADVNPL